MTKKQPNVFKGVAIILMFVHHLFGDAGVLKDMNVHPFVPQNILLMIASAGKVCVAIFVFASAYDITKQQEKSGVSNLAGRIIKIWMPFFFIYIFAAIAAVVTGNWKATYGKAWQSNLYFAVIDALGLANLFGTPTLNGTWWYMSAAIIFIICVPLFMIKEEYLVFILVAVAAFPRIISLEVMGITGIYAFLPVFLMGMCVAKYDLFNRWFKIWNAGMKHVFKFLLELLAVFILYKAYRTLPLTVYSEIHWGVYPIVFMAFCCEFINVIPGVRQILLFLGKHSMNIFLIHTFIRKSSFVYVSGYFLTNTLTLLLASLAVSIALEWLKKVSGYNRLIQNICVKIG